MLLSVDAMLLSVDAMLLSVDTMPLQVKKLVCIPYPASGEGIKGSQYGLLYETLLYERLVCDKGSPQVEEHLACGVQ
jgi:hypothetical protein